MLRLRRGWQRKFTKTEKLTVRAPLQNTHHYKCWHSLRKSRSIQLLIATFNANIFLWGDKGTRYPRIAAIAMMSFISQVACESMTLANPRYLLTLESLSPDSIGSVDRLPDLRLAHRGLNASKPLLPNSGFAIRTRAM